MYIGQLFDDDIPTEVKIDEKGKEKLEDKGKEKVDDKEKSRR